MDLGSVNTPRAFDALELAPALRRTRALVAIAVVAGCGSPRPRPPHPSAPPPPAELALEVTPADLGARPPGDAPELVVAVVNRATSPRTVPRPGPNAWLGMRAPLRYSFEVEGEGGWRALPASFFVGHPLPFEEPGELITLQPGERAILAEGIPPLELPLDHVGRIRARLTYDVGAELARWPSRPAGVTAAVLVSNPIEADQVPGPLELRLEAIAPLVVGTEVDTHQVLRVTVRNRSGTDRTLYGPGGITAGVGFELERPNGGTWPAGDRPHTTLAPEPAQPRVLRPGEVVEIFGPNPALGRTPSTWTYPVAETFRIRAILSQPKPGPSLYYSPWITLTARTP